MGMAAERREGVVYCERMMGSAHAQQYHAWANVE